MNGHFALPLALLRDAAWLTPQRAKAYCRILAVLMGILATAWIALGVDGLDLSGRPLGTDFLSFWAASTIALSGTPEAVYDIGAHWAAQRSVFPGVDVGYSAFFYPPVFLLICLPLGLLPYLAALAVWLAASGYAFWRVAGAFLGRSGDAALALLAFPAVFINIAHGQNGFLSAALLGGGVLALQKRPLLAGILFGCLVFKPHLAIVLPIALAARGAWRTFLVTGLTALGLCAASLVLFGAETWRGFLAGSALARRTLELGLVEPEKMQSVFAAVRLMGGSVSAGYALQALTAIAACGLLVVLARAGAKPLAQGAALVTAALLATPFLLDYDLVILAIPLAWLFSEARRSGFLSWEKLLILIAFVLPLLSRLVAVQLSIPLGPPVLIAVFAAVLRRGLAESVPAENRAGVGRIALSPGLRGS